jgi:hypothetical protein
LKKECLKNAINIPDELSYIQSNVHYNNFYGTPEILTFSGDTPDIIYNIDQAYDELSEMMESQHIEELSEMATNGLTKMGELHIFLDSDIPFEFHSM